MANNETTSVSKGVFVFKNGNKHSKKAHKSSKKSNMFSDNLWYQEFVSLWEAISHEYETLTAQIFASTTSDLLRFVETSREDSNEIPSAALLTGINMPDHEAQFKNLDKLLKDRITPHVALLHSQQCGKLKNLIESMIGQFLNNETTITPSLPLLQRWYDGLYETETKKLKLVVIILDFEGFSPKVLQNFILIISSYLHKLPFVLIFGIATSISSLYTSLPYHVISKINVQIFKCQPSTVHLNNVLEELLFTPFCPFQLGGRVFDLFTEIFLFYDFSVHNFVQNIKIAMMEHFCQGNAMALCQTDKKGIKEVIDLFEHNDYESVRRLLSFRSLVEAEPPENRIKLLTDDQYLKTVLYDKVIAVQKYTRRLHVFLKCLHVLVRDLPGAPMGKNLREIYALVVRKTITESKEYKECFQLLNFQSKDELNSKLEKIAKVMECYVNTSSKKTQLKDFCVTIKRFQNALDVLDLVDVTNVEIEPTHDAVLSGLTDRKALKEALMSRSKQQVKLLNKYEKLREEILNFLSKNFEIFMVHPSSLHLYEIFFFDDISIKDKIVGTHRSAIHNALNNPHYYLQCKCCEISNSRTVKATMPDICIAYKLHLEWGKMINLYDWLLAFLCIVDPKEGDDLDDKFKKVVNPELQARFTQAVAELEYLGFIKSSKRKTDHVMRLTWEG
ncbi:origin recognition complex subunit 3 [Euwallacea similis]|uniref:origin recognition complex subunit 3 n=1 Tax=Euwallacea similis TaxID=1736056 RepID=UPI00344DA756